VAKVKKIDIGTIRKILFMEFPLRMVITLFLQCSQKKEFQILKLSPKKEEFDVTYTILGEYFVRVNPIFI
jgi:hypothetical protein